MAGGGGEVKFPGVSFTDENTRAILFLKCENLKGKKKYKIFGPLEPSNGTVKVDIKKESVAAMITVEESNGSSTKYEYIKTLPEDINPAKSTSELVKLNRSERVKLILVKDKPGSWERHAKDLQKKD